MSNNTIEAIKAARDKLWNKGILIWKLDACQKAIYNEMMGRPDKVVTITCSRRLGKSHLLTVIALEICLKTPKSIVKFLQPEQKMIRMNIKPIMEEILLDCPDELRPEFKTQDNVYVFPNGSQIQLAGTDNGNAEKIRGGNCHAALIDEAGFCSDLHYLINSVLIPTTTLTRGKIYLSSTPSKSPDHEFMKYVEKAEASGKLIKKTIWDAIDYLKDDVNPRITKQLVDEIIESLPGGRESEDFRREYECDVVHNSDLSIIPEFTPDIEKDIVKEWPKPAHYDSYVSMDIGFKDLTVALFAYYDFEKGIIVIEDEVVLNGAAMTTDKLAETIKGTEVALWTNPLTGEFKKPYLRVSDNNLIVINDLQRLHGLLFVPTAKDNKDAQVNHLRMLIGARKLVINPKCKVLVSHLKNGNWKKDRKEFSRSPDSGHYDAIDAAIYLVRNIDKNKNPYPKGYQFSHIPGKDLFTRENGDVTRNESTFSGLFRRKNKR